jgi:hypothetical protein
LFTIALAQPSKLKRPPGYHSSLVIEVSLVLGDWDLVLPLTDENHPLTMFPPLGCSTCPDSRAINRRLELPNKIAAGGGCGYRNIHAQLQKLSRQGVQRSMEENHLEC